MKKLYSSIVLLFLILLGCQSSHQPILANDQALSINELQTYLFSDEETIRLEGDYYDALLNFRNSFPEVKHYPVTIIETNNRNNLLRHYNITTFPTLLLLNNDKIVIRIEGKQSKEKIYQLLKENLHDN